MTVPCFVQPRQEKPEGRDKSYSWQKILDRSVVSFQFLSPELRLCLISHLLSVAIMLPENCISECKTQRNQNIGKVGLFCLENAWKHMYISILHEVPSEYNNMLQMLTWRVFTQLFCWFLMKTEGNTFFFLHFIQDYSCSLEKKKKKSKKKWSHNYRRFHFLVDFRKINSVTERMDKQVII